VGVLAGALLGSVLFAGVIAIIQIAALALLRLLPWRGPRLNVDEDRQAARVFE
jgi:hypothetical protein